MVLLSRSKGMNMRSMNAGSIPTPLSATTKRKLAKPWGAPAFSATLMRTVLPAGEYLMALSTSWEHVGQAHGIHEHAIVGQRLNVAGQG